MWRIGIYFLSIKVESTYLKLAINEVEIYSRNRLKINSSQIANFLVPKAEQGSTN